MAQSRPIRFGLKGLFVSITFVALFLGALVWLARMPSIKITDTEIAYPKSLMLWDQPNRYVDGLTVIVSGNIDGKAKISIEGYDVTHTIGPGPFELDISPHE